jgi:PAS domain S-box-containing protein
MSGGVEGLLARRRPLDVDRLKTVWTVLLIAFAYYVAARLSLRYALVEENITPVWPPTGIALVGFLVAGRRIWPGVAAAAFLVNLPITDATWAAALTACGNTLAPFVASELLARVGFRSEIDRLRDAVALVALAALFSMAISATIGASTLVLTDAIGSGEFIGAWSVWWAGDAMGVLAVAPFLLTLPVALRRSKEMLARAGEASALLVVLVTLSFLAFTAEFYLLFAILPMLGLIAWRFQQVGAAPAALLVTGFATWAAVTERGPFVGGTLLDRMLTLQSFNAAVAMTSFVFAAVVTERMKARDALEEAAAELEERVRIRTLALSDVNEHLAQQMAEREVAETKLRTSERQLAEAQEIARFGSWEWDIATDRVSWSDELYRIHGYEPQELAMTFERAIALVLEEDRARISDNVRLALRHQMSRVPDVEYRIRRPDGDVRSLFGTGRLSFDADGKPGRMVGTVQDITERREHERDHRIAQSLQRALLPRELPTLDGFTFAARFLPAEASAGGDWYDVIPLATGDVVLVIGDVAGHGLEAASVMTQARMAVRAFALDGLPPAQVVSKAHALLKQLYEPRQMVTMLVVLIESATLEARVVNAGHPPPLLIEPGGTIDYLATRTSLPIGLDSTPVLEESKVRLKRGATIVLFTDGLIDRRDMSVDDGLEQLRSAAEDEREADPELLCARLVEALAPTEATDDVAFLVARLELAPASLHRRVPALPSELGSIRHSVRRWLSDLDVDDGIVDDVVLACSEACANAIEHAYGPAGGSIELDITVDGDVLEVVVKDVGRWRPTRTPERGLGLKLIETAMSTVELVSGEEGTEIRMRRPLSGVTAARSRTE